MNAAWEKEDGALPGTYQRDAVTREGESSVRERQAGWADLFLGDLLLR